MARLLAEQEDGLWNSSKKWGEVDEMNKMVQLLASKCMTKVGAYLEGDDEDDDDNSLFERVERPTWDACLKTSVYYVRRCVCLCALHACACVNLCLCGCFF